MSFSEVTPWLREELQRRVGAATRSLVAAVVAAAEGAPNSQQLSLLLQQQLHFKQQDAEALAPELLRRIAAAEAAAAAAAAAAADDEDQQEADEPQSGSRKRQREDETEPAAAAAAAAGAAAEDDDAAEAAAFAARLAARDMASQRKVGHAAALERQQQQQQQQQGDAAAAAAALESVEELLLEAKKKPNELLRCSKAYVLRLREEARRSYLKKREEQQLLLQERKVRDREAFYAQLQQQQQQQLSAAEQQQLQLRKDALLLAKAAVEDRKNNSETELYLLPEAEESLQARLLLLQQTFRETQQQQQQQQLSEQQLLEQQKTRAALVRFGARDRSSSSSSSEQQQKTYKLVDETGVEIEFEVRETHGLDFNKELSPQQQQQQQMLQQLEQQREASQTKAISLQEQRRLLPVYAYREAFLRAVAQHRVLVVVGATGSGKTTQLPQFLREVGYAKAGMVACTQPRRLAAMAVAARVAAECGERLGAEVGYTIRFEDCSSAKTQLKYMTDGMLLREFIGDPLLQQYAAVMVDEAHERTLHTDVLLALLKDLSRYREDFRLVISSATLEAERFASYFDGAPILRIPGRLHPVQIYYSKSPEANFVAAAVVTVLQLHFSQPPGDILVFLPGQQEIEEAVEEVQRRLRGRGRECGELLVLPLYSALPGEQQGRVFEVTPRGSRKCVFATNVAETSLTLEGVVYVIDSGFAKENQFSPKTGLESLVTVPCSKASANQRAGRAGRVRAGHCFRLYTRSSFEQEMPGVQTPEVLRCSLAAAVLFLKTLGVDDVLNFDFMDPPSPQTLVAALELLYALAALNERGELTKLGRRMAELPLEPMASRFVVGAEGLCVGEALTVTAMLGVVGLLFFRPREKALHADNARRLFCRPGGDPSTLLNIYQQWEQTGYSVAWCYENFLQHRALQRARDVREQLQGLLERVELEETASQASDETLRKALTAGYFTQAARLNRQGTFTTLKNPQTVEIHPQSSLFGSFPSFVVYTELTLTTKEYMRAVFEVRPEWLAEAAPHYYQQQQLQQPKLPRNLAPNPQEQTLNPKP